MDLLDAPVGMLITDGDIIFPRGVQIRLVVSDSEMAEEIAKMYEIDESPLHVKEKEVEPVKKEESSLEVEPVQKEESSE